MPLRKPIPGKESVCPTSHQKDQRVTEKNNEGITAPTQKAGFTCVLLRGRVPKTFLWLMEV